MVPQVELFSFVFWENWRHQKDISKLTDLYYCTRYYAETLLFAFAKKGNSVQSKMFNFASQLMVKSCILAKRWTKKLGSEKKPSFLKSLIESKFSCFLSEKIQVIPFQINIFCHHLTHLWHLILSDVLKVRLSRKQIMVSSLLPKNECWDNFM